MVARTWPSTSLLVSLRCLSSLSLSSVFPITGINSIKPYIEADPDADAADIVIELMELFGEYHVVLRILVT
jgi:hypothetical protein